MMKTKTLMLGWMMALCCFGCTELARQEKEPHVIVNTAAKSTDSIASSASDSIHLDESMEMVAQDSAIKVMKCSFVDVEFGDYLHFDVKDEQGKQHSFYLADDLPYSQWKEFDFHPKKMKGKQLEIEWRNVDKFLKAAGAVNNIDEITNINIVE